MAAATEIIDRKVEFTTPWFQVIAKHVAGERAPYYALRLQDYVSIVAFTEKRELVLVRQYRPAVERYTLELPSGHVEADETPAQSARRELAEECGLDAPQPELLGPLLSDTGRHENRLWCYFASGVTPLAGGYVPEPGLERILVPQTQLPHLLANAEFDHALNHAALLLAVAKHGPELLALSSRKGP
jgi:ADP-ribose pyrophosphatase